MRLFTFTIPLHPNTSTYLQTMVMQAQHVMFEPESLPSVRLVTDRANAPRDIDLLLIAVTQEDVTKKEGEVEHTNEGGYQAFDVCSFS